MATRAEQDRSRKQRRGITEKAKKRASQRHSRAEKYAEAHANIRAERKSTYAYEAPSRTGAPSRKSTRAAANRSKTDTNFNLREEMQKGSPQSRFTKARTKRIRVRGSAAW